MINIKGSITLKSGKVIYLNKVESKNLYDALREILILYPDLQQEEVYEVANILYSGGAM